MPKKKPTQARLKEVLLYDPLTGIFIWKENRGTNKCKGLIAGTKNHPHGYIYIRLDGKNYKASRLAWLYMEGYYPEMIIEHKDRNRANDKWNNLRHVSQRCNLRNGSKRSTNKTGVIGVCWDKSKKSWHAQITVSYKNIWIGRFKLFHDAVKARWAAEKKYCFPDCNTTSSAFCYLKREGLI